jgi:U3 small nucleolar RNA-associated protein 3
MQIDKHHGKRLGKLQNESDEEHDEDLLDEAPVFDMKRGDSDDDDDDDDEEAYDDEDDDDSDDEERRDAAIAKENKLLTAWGSKRSAFYDNDAEVEIDEEAAAAEEEEAIRIQKKRAAELDEDDLTFGAKPKKTAVAEPADTMGNRLTNKSAKKTAAVEEVAPKHSKSAVERVAKDLTNLTKQQKLDIVMADTPELLGLLDELKAQVAEVRNTLAPILTAVASGKIKTTKGISFLEAKQQILLAYIADITFYLLLKAEGASVRDHPVIGQLVHIRTLLEKMRPLDAKMAHQVSRLLKAAKAAPSTASKADTAHVESEEDNEDEEQEVEKPSSKRDHKSKSKPAANKELDDAIAQLEGVTEAGHDAEITGGVFKPLRRTAVMYDDDPAHTKQQKQAERRKKKISESALLADLRAAYTDAPEEAGMSSIQLACQDSCHGL